MKVGKLKIEGKKWNQLVEEKSKHGNNTSTPTSVPEERLFVYIIIIILRKLVINVVTFT